jgi:hypothetical protein
MSHAFLLVLERRTTPLLDRGGLAAAPIGAIMETLEREVFDRTGLTVRPLHGARPEPMGTTR